jgi:hypothetical protein
VAPPDDLIRDDEPSVPAPRWVARSLVLNEGRDPLGFQTMTQDRLMPVLLPGVLELSRRARYFSFYAFLLDEYRNRRMPADGESLSAFIKRCEWDLGLAVQRCPSGCGSSPVGARRLGGQAAGPGPFLRGESVESAFGGYGLYYRSPMIVLGIIAKSGTLLGGQPIPIDVLYRTERAARLVDGFRSAVGETAYYRRWMWTDQDLPAEVVDEYAAVACLCRLRERTSERGAVHDALFGTDPPDAHSAPRQSGPASEGGGMAGVEFSEAGATQRRRSIGHYLTLIDAHPEVVYSQGAYREALWSPPTFRSSAHALVADQWAALVAKDVWQEAICSLWSEFCRAGLARTRDLGRGLTWDETREVAAGMVDGLPRLDRDQPTSNLVAALAANRLTVADADGVVVDVTTTSLEALRALTARLDTATSGLIVLLELARRAGKRSGTGWVQAAHIASAWQPSIAAVFGGLRSHLEASPSVSETLWWLVSRFVIPVHERIAYSKLPEFTFRFRWEEGLLRFYDHGVGRFPLAAVRNDTLASLTRDLGMWDVETAGGERRAVLTRQGAAFVDEALRD